MAKARRKKGRGKEPTVVAVTGATGAVYAKRLLELLPTPVLLVMTEHGEKVARLELKEGSKDLEKMATKVLDNHDLGADISSGSGSRRNMVIVPCSMNTMSKIACGIADNLVTRAASVCLKQGWRLVMVPRETPLSMIHIENMGRLKRAGAIILPASPGFYNLPSSVEELVDFVVGKILEALGHEKESKRILKEWKGL
jgi:4-hydroxy-3-polyprenylbenzoate decarboxylase